MEKYGENRKERRSGQNMGERERENQECYVCCYKTLSIPSSDTVSVHKENHVQLQRQNRIKGY